MRYSILAAVLASVMVSGCATSQKSYQTTTTVSPAGQQQYTIGWTIQATEEDGSENVLSTPRVTVQAGSEGSIKVCDDNEENGVFCTALVTKTPQGLEALTTVTVKKNGKAMLKTSQKTIVKE